MNEFKIDYAIISNDENPDYRGLRDRITKRWNDIGIKVVYADVVDESNKLIQTNSSEDSFGNIYIPIVISSNDRPWYLWRHFPTTIARFVIATLPKFSKNTLIISDGDLFPINKKYIYCPSKLYDGLMGTSIESGHLITTNHYANGDALATYTYGLGSTFTDVFDIFLSNYDLHTRMTCILNHAAHVAKNVLHKMYLMEEPYLNHIYKEYPKHQKIMNRKWLEQVQEMNNLYDYQIDFLDTPFDLCPFIEFHNMRASTMTETRWNKLFKLLEEFDKYPITPNNWYYETISYPWRDTIITKTGELILGCEYDN